MEHLEILKSLRQKRLAKSFTQGNLAERLGVNQTYVAKVELGEKIPSNERLIRKWAEVLGINPKDLLDSFRELNIREKTARARTKLVRRVSKKESLSAALTNYISQEDLFASGIIKEEDLIIEPKIGDYVPDDLLMLGRNIRIERRKRRYSLQEFADITEMNHNRLAEIECGAGLYVDEFVIIVKALAGDAPVKELFDKLVLHIKSNDEKRIQELRKPESQSELKELKLAAAWKIDFKDYKLLRHVYNVLMDYRKSKKEE
jgi:transcriptional regulator with XRE-family HTH domain